MYKNLIFSFFLSYFCVDLDRIRAREKKLFGGE